ncbi:MAG: PAS domain S-box protein, partial [Desulfobacterales bacterium]|nr:PAS domain S-box protein [Desulfobacterales bacterium]
MTKRFFFSCIPIVLLCLACFAGCVQAVATPVAKEGMLDLRSWSFGDKGNIRLNGEWQFYWRQLVPPAELQNSPGPPSTGAIRVPGRWNGFPTAGGEATGEGYATYHLRVQLPEGRHRLGLKLLDMASAFTLYIDGKKLVSSGHPGTSRETSQPAYRPQVVDVGPKSGALDIVFHVSNFHHWQGGFWEPVYLGELSDIQWQREWSLFLDFILLGCIVIMGVYHLGMFAIRTRNRSLLYFALFNLLVAVRMLATDERFLSQLFPTLGFRAELSIVYISFFLVLPVFAQYVYALFPEDTSKRVVRFIWTVSVGLSLFVLAAPLPLFTRVMPPFQIFTIGVITYGAWVAVRAVWYKRQGGMTFLGGFIILAVVIINDILYTRQIIGTGHYVPWGFFLFIFSQALLIYQRFARAFNTVEKQWRELARTNVKYQTELKQRRLTQDALRASEQQYRSLIENSADGICIVRTSVIVYANPRFIGMFEIDENRFGQQTFMALVHINDRERLADIYKDWTQDGMAPRSFSIRGNDRDDKPRHLEISVSAIDWEKEPGVLTLVRDVTEQVRTRELLFQSEKMLSIGGLAAGMAHEINNPLAGMMTNAQLVQRRMTPDKPANVNAAGRLGVSLADVGRYADDRGIYKSLQHIVTAGRHAAEIVENMLSFARKSTAEKTPWLLDDIVDKALVLANNDFKLKTQYDFRSIRIEKQIESSMGPVLCEESKIRQVLLNLFKNAAQAMASDSINGTDPEIRIRLFSEGGMACLMIRDNGPGMPEAVRKRIFEPFF